MILQPASLNRFLHLIGTESIWGPMILQPASLNRFLHVARPPKRRHIQEPPYPRLGPGKDEANGGQVLIEAHPGDGNAGGSHKGLARHFITGTNSLLLIKLRLG